MIETRVENEFIAKADETSYRRIVDQSNYYYPEEETKDFAEEDNKLKKLSS